MEVWNEIPFMPKHLNLWGADWEGKRRTGNMGPHGYSKGEAHNMLSIGGRNS